MNKYGFALAGSLTAIISARLYVGLGGSLNFSILNHTIHHLYYGIALLVISAILKRKNASESLIFFILGMALGYIADESDLFLSIGRPYTMQLYYAPLNLAMDTILILVLFRLSENRNYVHGLLYDTEHVL